MNSQSISTRFNVALAVIVTAIMLIFAGLATFIASDRIFGALDAKLDNYLRISSVSLQAPLWNFDHNIVEGYLDSLMLDNTIVLVRVVSGDGTVIRRARKDHQDRKLEQLVGDDGYTSRRVAIKRDGKDIGKIGIVATRSGLKAEISTNILAIVLLTLAVLATITLASVLISRRYIVQPLAALQISARAIGEGNLGTNINADRHDEIGDLARSFESMRNSIRELVDELRHANESLETRVVERTQEVTATQQKLVDAIESTSEGFAFFDAQDRLVLHNARYQELLYGDEEIEIAPGMSFEEILRAGVANGVISVGTTEIEEFVQERLENHRNPGLPILQRRGNDKWIQISERKTSDGGTVAVFSDISELKVREADLTDKTMML
ncbi:MAG: PAS-domain containing protein, partial [Hyphomicrobiaceae bacterium]